MSLASEYEKIIQYFEDKKSSEKIVKKEVPKKSKPKPKKKKAEVKKQEPQKVEISIDDFDDVPDKVYPKYQYVEKSNYFSVELFKANLRKRLIDEHLVYQNYERPYISISELYICLRFNYYNRKKYKVDLEKKYQFALLYLINQVGNTVHDVIQNNYNFDDVEKTVVSEKYKIKGRADAVKDQTLYEIKTIDVYNGNLKNEFVYQAMIGAFLLNEVLNYNITNITIIQVTRDLKNIYPVDLNYDSNIAIQFINRAPMLIEALKTNQIIDPIGATKDQCTWCPYKGKYCNQNLDKKQKVIKQDKKKDIKVKPTKVKSTFLL